MAHPSHNNDQLGSDNAFNRYADKNYWYQSKDIEAISKELLQGIKNVKFVGALGRGHDILNTKAILAPLLPNLAQGTRLVGAYNTDGNHWIAFAIIESDNKKKKVAYNDSLGQIRENFEQDMKEILGNNIEFCQYLDKTLEDSSGCGLFAIKNMEVLANANDIDAVDEFYSPKSNYSQTISLLRRDFAVIYAKRIYEETTKTLTVVAKRDAVCELRDSEGEKLKQLISDKINCEITCKVVTEENAEEYSYHVVFAPADTEQVKVALREFVKNQEQIEAVDLHDGKSKIKIIPADVDNKDILEIIEINDKETVAHQAPSDEKIQADWKQALKLGVRIFDQPLKDAILDEIGVELEDGTSEMLPDGLKRSLHGNLYQWSLLIWVALKADYEKQFQLITEAKGFEKFDDLVLKYDDRIIFLQAKHSSKDPGTDDYTKKDFVDNNYKGEASLAKYFDSWYRLKDGKYKVKDGYYVFITNRNVQDSDDYLENHHVDIPELKLGARTLKFKKGDSRKDFITAIRASSEEVADYDGDYDIDIGDDVYEDAATYLAKKFKDFTKGNKNGKPAFVIDGKAGISKKARAVIKLAQECNDVLNKIIEIITKKIEERKRNAKDKPVTNNEADFKKWLTAKENDEFKIKTDIKNAKGILSNVLLDDINKFLDQYILKVEQPNLDEMLNIIQKETSFETQIAAYEFCINVGQKVLIWFAEPKICDMGSDEIKNMIEEAKGDAYRFYFLYETLKIDTLEGTALPEIKNFLETKDQFVVRIENAPDLYLRLAQSIMEHVKHKDKCAFFKGTSNYLEHAQTAMNGTQIQVAVFDYSGNDDKVPFKVIDLPNILKSSKKKGKKIILLIKKNDNQFDQFGQELQIESELSDNFLDQVINNKADKTVNLAGKNFSLSALTKDKNAGFYHALKQITFLKDILEQSSIEELGLGLPCEVYIRNELVRGKHVYQWPSVLLEVKANLLVINGTNVYELNNVFQHDSFKEKVVREHEEVNEKTKYRFIENISKMDDKQQDVIHICIGNFLTEEEKQQYNTSYIILDVDEGVATIRENGNVRLPIVNSYRFLKENIVERSDIKSKNFCVVSADAGRGKSSFCLNERYEWVQKEETGNYSWVVRINLAFLKFNDDTPQNSDKDFFNKKTTEVAWPDWQLKAFTHDMNISGMVRILLDGFDEIKDKLIIQKLGEWMLTLPREVDLILTTRPYAAHNIPMPDNRDLDLFLTLNQYTDVQRDDYVRNYITSTLKNRNYITSTLKKKKTDTNNIEKIVEKYKEMITSSPDNITSTLGIPLESYLFCSGFESDMFADCEKLEKGDDIKRTEVSLSAIDLFERFLKAKLSIFLQKHLQIESNLKPKSELIFYTSTTLYMAILQAFAFKQAFDLDYQVVRDALNEHYFDDDKLNYLADTGFVILEERGEEYYLSFNHMTYQEYLAALKIVSGLLSNNSDVKKIFKEYKHYKPAFRVIFQFAAQISLGDSNFLPRFDQIQNAAVFNLWGALFGDVSESRDVLGVAEADLIKCCLNVLSDNSLKTLKDLSIGESWHNRLCDIAKTKSKDSNQNSETLQQDAPVERTQKLKQQAVFNTRKVETKIQKFCDDKNSLNNLEDYINTFEWNEQRKVREILAEELASREKKWDDKDCYWALDFGIPAIGCCGEFFSQNLANKLKIRAEFWENNFKLALTSLDTIYDTVSGTIWNENKENIQDVFYYAIGLLLDCKYKSQFSKANFLNLRKVSNGLLKYFQKSTEYISSIPKMFRIAKEAGYAVVISANDTELRFIGENEVISQKNPEFKKVLDILNDTQDKNPENPEDFINKFEENDNFIKLKEQEGLKKEIKDKDDNKLSAYFNKKFDFEFSWNSYRFDQLENFFNNLKEINPPYTTINIARKVVAEMFLKNKNNWWQDWHSNFGAKAIVYCGQYITDDIKKVISDLEGVAFYSDVADDIKSSCYFLIDELNDEARKVQNQNELQEIADGLSQILDILTSIDIKAIQELKTNITALEDFDQTKKFSFEQKLFSRNSDSYRHKKKTNSDADYERRKKLQESMSVCNVPNYLKDKFSTFSKKKDSTGLKQFFDDLRHINNFDINIAKIEFANKFLDYQRTADGIDGFEFGAKTIAFCGRYITEDMKKKIKLRKRVCCALNVENWIKYSCYSLIYTELTRVVKLAKMRVVTFANICEIKKIADGLKQILEILQSIDLEAKNKIRHGQNYIESIKSLIDNGCDLEQARMLVSQGITLIQKDEV